VDGVAEESVDEAPEAGSCIRTRERESSIQPMAMAMTAAISITSSHPAVRTFSLKTVTP
jgi:hypothetical protein